MEKSFGKDYPVGKREEILKANCDKIEAQGYMKRLSPDQILQKKEQLSEVAININDLEIDKKEALKSFKEQIDPLVGVRTDLLKAIKEKAVYVKEECYKFIEADERMVGYYNGEGDLIEARPATADELQGTIFQIGRKTGTND
jgi:hypothetical protein